MDFPCFALIQRGYVIYGVGDTESAAREDAEQWLDDSDRTEGGNHGDLAVVLCSKKLADTVRESGGDVVWVAPLGRDDDGICLPEELPRPAEWPEYLHCLSGSYGCETYCDDDHIAEVEESLAGSFDDFDPDATDIWDAHLEFWKVDGGFGWYRSGCYVAPFRQGDSDGYFDRVGQFRLE